MRSFSSGNMEGAEVPEILHTPYEQAGPRGPMRVKDEDTWSNPTPYSQTGLFRLNVKSHHPQKRSKLYIHHPDTVADRIDELFGDKPRLVPITAETAKSIEDGCKEMSKTKIGVFAPPVSLKLETPKHPYLTELGDLLDAYWECPEFLMIRGRVPEFLKQAGVKSISNATHGNYLAAQFEDYIAENYPDEWKKVEAMSPYEDALQEWHEDHLNDSSE
jgi:hypothetical protein